MVSRLLLALALACAGGPAARADEVLEFPAIADADVDAGAPAANYGSASRLRADAASERIVYLRFTVAGIEGRPVLQARLRLEVSSGSGVSGGVVHAADPTWDESTVTYATRPALGPPVDALGPVAGGQLVDFVVDDIVTGDGSYDLALTSPSSDGVAFHSSESTKGRRPVLVVVVAAAGTPRVSITQPAGSTTFFAGHAVTLAGFATDADGGDLSAGIVWRSNVDGVLGMGPVVSASLSIATHQITAVLDATGDGAAVAITIVPRELVFTAVADTVVDATRPSSPLGTTTSLKVNFTPPSDVLVRFAPSGIPQPIKAATLRFTVGSSSGAASDAGGLLHQISDHTWSEAATTFDTRPPVDGPALASAGGVRANAAVDFDVTRAIGGDGLYDFALVGRSSDSATYRSRESSTGRPQLIIHPRAVGDDPVIAITAPGSGTVVPFGTPLALRAIASDPQEGDLSAHAEWMSDVDGFLGTGSSCSWILGPGTHTLSASITDGDRNRVATTTIVRVTEPDVGLEDFVYGSTAERASDPITGQKPESKLWHHDGNWWAMLFRPAVGAYDIHRLDPGTQTWIDTGVRVDERPKSRQDVLAEGDKLWVASRHLTSPQENRLLRFTYLPEARTYALDPGFPVRLSGAGAETLTLARDSQGTLWTAYTRDQRVFVNRTLGTDTQWGSAFVVPVPEGTTVHADDIAAVQALPGRIGVFWNSHLADKFYLALHTDGRPATDPAAWTLEVAATGANVADDHLNLKVAPDGRLFVAVKTDRLGPDATTIGLLVRSPTGIWSPLHTVVAVAFEATRPQCLIDESGRRVYVVYSARNAIHYKTSDLDVLGFPGGIGSPLIAGTGRKGMNNPTTTKQTVDTSTGLVLLASTPETTSYWHAMLPLPAAPPGSCTGE